MRIAHRILANITYLGDKVPEDIFLKPVVMVMIMGYWLGQRERTFG